MTDSRISSIFQGRTALITGSGKNIGRAIAIDLAKHGASVVVNGYHDATAVQKVVEEIRIAGLKCVGIMADVSNPDDVKRLVEETVSTYGTIDIVVSNAAIRPRQSLLSMSLDDWHRVIDTNLSASFYLAKYSVPHMIRKGWGRIIHITGHDAYTGMSATGHDEDGHAVCRPHNVAAKSGLHGLTKALAHELREFGITVNEISPGVINTIRNPYDYPNIEQIYQKLISSGRITEVGSASDIAEACTYLCQQNYVTGQVIQVNGGLYMP